nr:uncharacterized protein LOC110359646 isoform X2 [Columba livia]
MPLETSDETTPPLSSPGVLEQFLLTRDSPEDLNSQLSLCNDQSVPDYLVSAFVYLPYYRTSYVFISPSSHAASHISTETEESFNEGKVNTKQDETTIPPSLDLEKRAFSSMTDKQPRVHHLLRDRTFGHCSSTISFSSGLPGLNQPFPSTGYFPYYRTEEELCPSPVLGDRFFHGIGGLVNKDGEERGETDIWSLSSNCLLC